MANRNFMRKGMLFQSFVLKILFYIIYRTIKFIIDIESMIWMITKNIIYQEKECDDGKDVEIYDVLIRHKFYIDDPSKETDFIYFHNSFTSYEKILKSNNWHFYSLTEYYAYFIYLHESYDFKTNESFTTYAFKHCTLIAKVNAEDFLTTTSIVKNINGKTINLFAMSYSCIDDILSVLQHLAPSPKYNDKKIQIFKDYSSLDSVLKLIEMKNNLTIDECRKIVLNGMKCILKNQKDNEIWFIEMRPENIALIPYIHSSLPSIIHVYYGRDKIDQALLYYLKEHDYKDNQLKELIVMRKKMKKLMAFFTWKGYFERSLLNRVKPQNQLQLALTLISKSVLDYRLNRKYFISDIIYYERFITDPYITLTNLLKNCGLLNQFSVPEITSIKEHQVKRKFTSEEIEEIKNVTELIGLYDENKRSMEVTSYLDTDCYL
uniref:Glycosyl transferase n=1 Tax=Parastrongyloides trichosuri TaxID=131310 RepID=A0A0N4ZDQ4_PARTI